MKHLEKQPPSAEPENPPEQIRAAGLRSTPQRLGVLEVLRGARGKHLSAEDVWRELQGSGGAMDRSTAYRVLNDLCRAGIIQEAHLGDGVSRFEIQEIAHHHAVCTNCGITEDVPVTLVHRFAKELIKENGFVVGAQPLLIAGLCAACSGATRTS